MDIKYWFFKIKGLIKRNRSLNIANSSFIASRSQLLGIDNISIGDNCVIGENTTFTINDRSSNDIKLKIGSNTYIGRNNFFTVGGSIEIGEYCIFGNNCSFLCSDHSFENPLIPYALSGSTTNKKIRVGVNCWFGINVSIVGNVSIGHGCIVGANTVITKDIPPFSMAVGNPSKIIKRFDFKTGKWVKNLVVSESSYFDESIYLETISKIGDLPRAYHSSSSKFGDI